MMNKRKIDPSVLYKVNSQSYNLDNVECVVYSNNFFKTKHFLENSPKCKVYAEYPFINAFAVNVCPSSLGFLSSIKHINYITSQAKVFTQVAVSKKIMNVQKLYEEGFDGSGVTIAFIDTGVHNHIDFVMPKNRVLAFKDFANYESEPYDDNGHGTFVTSVACGNGLAGGKVFCGVAPRANIISLKALDKNGETGAFTILEAMQWIHDNKAKYNIRVVCMSFGSQPLSSGDPLIRGAETLWNDGIVVVVAAGNSGPDSATIKSPGVSTKVITVGAMNDERDETGNYDESKFHIANFSSRGPVFNNFKPDLVTSGVNLTCCSNKPNELYTTMSGTSVATPLVAGLCALIVQKYPTITPLEVKGMIVNSCKRITGNRNDEGFGYFQIE